MINIQGKNKWNENKRIIDKILGDFKKSEEQIIYLFDNDMSYEIGSSVIAESMFFVGDQDIEDSLDDDLWLIILNDYYKGVFEFTLEEIKIIKNKVPKNAKCRDFEKFYPILKNHIKSKSESLNIDYDSLLKLPSKGAESAEFLLNFISSDSLIPQKIKDAFDKLRSE